METTLNWKELSRILEATDSIWATKQIRMFAKEMNGLTAECNGHIMKILSRDLKANNIALAKATIWVGDYLGVHYEEMDSALTVNDDLGEATYYMDSSATTKENMNLSSIIELLEINCSKKGSSAFRRIEMAFDGMSSLERKWFIRYWLRTPRNGINRGNVIKIIANRYNKKIADVKKHTNFNSITNVTRSYHLDLPISVNLSFGRFVKPMLAKEIPMREWPRKFIADYKYDGNRYQIHKEGSGILIFNRKGKIVTEKFPDVVDVIREYKIDKCILDGEIYPINEDGSPAEHKKMGTRVHSKNVTEAMSRVPVEWVIFDCLLWGEETLMDLPLSQRLERVSKLPNQATRITEGNILQFYDEAIRKGFEGIIIKDSSLAYEPNKRSRGWAKYKPPLIELDIAIISASYGEGKRKNVFATFEMGVKSENGYVSIGQVGNGLADYQYNQLTLELKKNVERYDNGKFYFLPKVVLEVKADLVSQDAKGNIGLRFPRVSRIRDDKFVEDINTIEDMERLL